MAVSLDQLLPRDLLDPARVQEVVKFLQQMHVPAPRKREILGRWARASGVEIPEEVFRTL